jgi:hypothetical protein
LACLFIGWSSVFFKQADPIDLNFAKRKPLTANDFRIGPQAKVTGKSTELRIAMNYLEKFIPEL